MPKRKRRRNGNGSTLAKRRGPDRPVQSEAHARRQPNFQGSDVGEGFPFAGGFSGPLDPGIPGTPTFEGGNAARFSTDSQVNSLWTSGREVYGLLSAHVLDRLAETNDIFQAALSISQNELSGIDWGFVATDAAMGQDPMIKAIIEELTEFWKMPDPINGNAFPDWIKKAYRNIQVADDLTIEPLFDFGGRVKAFPILDGKTIIPKIDKHGYRPEPPWVAYQQAIRGELKAEFAANELYYHPTDPRSDSPYGRGALEKIFTHIVTGISEWETMLQETQGDIVPRVWFETPDGWTEKQITNWVNLVNDLTKANRGKRFDPHVLPKGSKVTRVNQIVWSKEKTEWLARITCAVLGVNPTPFIAIGERATAETLETIVQDSGIQPWKNVLQGVINDMVRWGWGKHIAELVHFEWITDKTEVSLERMESLGLAQEKGWFYPWQISEQILGQEPDDGIRALPLGFSGSTAASADPFLLSSGVGESGPSLPTPEAEPTAAPELTPEPEAAAPAPGAADVSLNDLRLALEPTKAIGDTEMLNVLRGKMAELLGVPPLKPLAVQSDVQDEIEVDQAETVVEPAAASDPPPAPPAAEPIAAATWAAKSATSQNIEAGISDLRRWRHKARKYGVDSARARRFASEFIPDDVRDVVRTGLEAAAEGEEFTATDVFAIAKARLTNQRSPEIEKAIRELQKAALEMLEEQEPELAREALARYQETLVDATT